MYRNQKSHVLGMLMLVILLTATMAAVYPNQQTEGNIATIDPDNHQFVLVDNNNNLMQMRFLVGGEVLINDREATLWDVLPGDRATVTYESGTNTLNATAIHCRRN